MYNPIDFPGLGIGPFDPNPVMFTLFGMPVKWYGVLMAVGFLLAALYGTKRAPVVGIKADDISDALLFCVPAGILGARIYYVIFNWGLFADNPVRAFYIWEGGIAFYGSLLGALLCGVIFARVRKISPLALTDIAVVGFLIGQCIGRWGNYFNREAYGSQTSLPWRMELAGTDAVTGTYGVIQVHPTFLYESLWTGLGFLLLHFLLTRRKYDGQITLCYLAWYGLGRGVIEGLRADSLYLFHTGLRVSQVLSFAFCAAGLGLLILFHFRPPAKAIVPSPAAGPPEAAETGESENSGDDTEGNRPDAGPG